MSKPAAGTLLDTGDALYAGLAGAWAVLESSGTTLADSKAGNTATLPGANASIVANSGSPYLSFAAATAGATLASALALPSISAGVAYSFSVAWGMAANSGLDGMVCGDTSTSFFLRVQQSAGTISLRAGGFSGDVSFTGLTGLTADHNFVLAGAWSGSAWSVKLYQDGVQVGGTQTPGGIAAVPFKLDRLGNGYSGTSFGFVGRIDYLDVWDGRLLTLSEAGDLNTDPYTIFQAGGGGGGTPSMAASRPLRQTRSRSLLTR